MSVVLAGPYNSRSYVIGSYVLYVTQTKCPSFFYQLIPMKTESWKDWLRKICVEEKWNFEDLRREKVLSWWEQNYSGGPKVLLGGLPRLLEYLKDKYDVSRDLSTEQVAQLIKESTEHWKEVEEEEAKNRGSGGNISIIGAGSNEAVPFLLYALMTTRTPVIRSGIKIKLFEATDEREEQLKKNFDRMSTVESNINICIVDDLFDVFKNCDLLIFVGDKFRTTGMDIEKFLYLEKVLYGSYGFLCNYHMEEQTKVIFACMENAAFNATCFLAEAPTIDKKKVVALTSYLGTELKLYISKMAGFPVESLEQIPVWGMADTCHLVDVDMGSLIFRIPDRFNPKYPNIKSLARLIEDETLRVQLYKMWKVQQDKSVAEWRWSKLKENLKIDEAKANMRSRQIEMLNNLACCYKEMERKSGRIPYWSVWDKAMAQAQEGEDYYSPENMYKRFKKGLYQVVQDNRYFEKEEMKATKKLEDKYKKIAEKAETLADYVDPLKLGLICSDSVRKFLEEEFFKEEMKMTEEDDADELCDETEIPDEVKEIELLRRDVYNKRNELKKKIRSYWKRHMEEEIARLENELRRKSLAAVKEEETIEEEWMAEENISKVEVQSDKESPSTPVTESTYRPMFGEEEEEKFEETIPQEIKLPEREVLNRMIKDYFRTKMKLERKVKRDLEEDSEPAESYRYEEIDDYEIRELGFITRSMKNLWNFIGICKNAVRQKIGQDPYIAQVHELIRVLKIWFFDPYMTSEITFLGIASDYDVYPFLTDTVMSQPAYCDEDFRWQPLKEAKHLWPKTPLEKVPDTPEMDVPFFKTPREGLPFTIKYVMGTSLECLMHFEIPPASYFETQRKLQEYADQKEFVDAVFTTREADKAQLIDLFRRMGQEVESSVEDFMVEEEELGEEVEEEGEVELEANLEGELEGEEELGEEVNEEMALEEGMTEEENDLSGEVKHFQDELKPESPFDERIEELDRLGAEEYGAALGGELVDHEGEDFKSVAEEFNQDEYDEDDPLNFLRGYNDLTIEEFLELFEKKREPVKEVSVQSEIKPPRRPKSLWKCYLERIGFYNLDVPEIYVNWEQEEEKEEEVENNDSAQKMEPLENEVPDNPFNEKIPKELKEPKVDVENENEEEISKDEGSEEMSEEFSQKLKQKIEEDPAYLTRGIGFIENIERDFTTRNFTEMPYYDHLNMRIGVDIAENSIYEIHTEKVGFPIDNKGRSQTDMGLELMKMDIGKEMIRSTMTPDISEEYNKYNLEGKGSSLQVPVRSRENCDLDRTESFQVTARRHQNKEHDERVSFQAHPGGHFGRASTVSTKRLLSQVLPPGIVKVSLAPYDENSEGGSTDSFIPESLPVTPTEGDVSEESVAVDTQPKRDDPLQAFFEKGLIEEEESSDDEDDSSDYDYYNSLHQKHFECSEMGCPIKPKVTKQQRPKGDWVHELVEEFNSPAKVAALDRASYLASLTPAYQNMKKKQQRKEARIEANIANYFEKGLSGEECKELQEEHNREAWIKGFEKLKRIMELERISGNSYLHFELDDERDRLKAEVACMQEKRFSDWIDSVINEHERIQTIRESSLGVESIDFFAFGTKENEEPELIKKGKGHRIWIKQMIREIIVVDQIYDLENVIESVKMFGLKVDDNQLLSTVTGNSNRSTVRFSVLADLGGILKGTPGGIESEDDLVPSDEDVLKKDEDLHRLPHEQERVLREITKTEKEITKGCKDLASYVQKCRDNTKLYCLYKGDTPPKWRFLNREPNESKLRFRYKALIHIMMTMKKLEEKFHKEMEELQDQEMDFSKVLSDAIGEEEMKKYSFVRSSKSKTSRCFPK